MNKMICLFLAVMLCSRLLQGCESEQTVTESSNLTQHTEVVGADPTDNLETTGAIIKPEYTEPATEPVAEATTEYSTEIPTISNVAETDEIQTEPNQTEQEITYDAPGENDTELVE